MAQGTKKISVRMDLEVLEQVQLIADSRGEPVSETIRELINRGLNDKVVLENNRKFATTIAKEIDTRLEYVLTDIIQKQLEQEKALEKILSASALGFNLTKATLELKENRQDYNAIQIAAVEKTKEYLEKQKLK